LIAMSEQIQYDAALHPRSAVSPNRTMLHIVRRAALWNRFYQSLVPTPNELLDFCEKARLENWHEVLATLPK
jgi:hypothetical protein